MFRAQQNAFDEAVAKATDENLTSVNWEYMLDVCDRASESATAPTDAVQALIKRLAHRNANVQLYTLELANSLAQNCGAEVHRELASRAFTEALLRLAGDRTTHQQVKASIVERMEEWTKMFQGNHDLGIMEQAFNRLKQTNPNLQPPSKPNKQQITDADRRKEEEELQMALQLSIKENTTTAPAAASSNAPTGAGAAAAGAAAAAAAAAPVAANSQQSQTSHQQTQPVSSGTTAATVSRVRALFDFQPSEPGELPFKKGDIIAVIESVYRDWWRGSLRGQTGIFPLNYVEKLADPTPEELAREAQMEAEVFGEIKNVEKLLTLLSTSGADGPNMRDNEEITTLYHSTLAIRPKLIELIGKYSQRKDDFEQLNEKFIKARRDYETLLDQSMSQPQQPYGRAGQPPYGQAPYGHQQPPQQQQPQQTAYGQYPPQSDPSRFYAPAGTDPSHTPQPQQPQQQQQQPPQQQQQQRHGQQPFYVAGQGPGGLPPVQTQYAATPQNDSPVAGRPPNQTSGSDPYNRRPESTYDAPQEIGTSGYQSPTEARPPASANTYSGQQPATQQAHQTYQPYAAAQQPQTTGQQQQQPAPSSQGPYPGAFAPDSPLSPIAPLNPHHSAHAAPAEGSQAPYQQPQYGSGQQAGAQTNSYAPYTGQQQGAQPPSGGVYPGQATYQAYQSPQPNDPANFYR